MSGENKGEMGIERQGVKNTENKGGRREKCKGEQLRAREDTWQRERERERERDMC